MSKRIAVFASIVVAVLMTVGYSQAATDPPVATGLCPTGTTSPLNSFEFNQCPVSSVSLWADPASIVQGGSSTLHWSAFPAHVCRPSWGIGDQGSDGSSVVSPSATTTYSMACWTVGPEGNPNPGVGTTTVTVTAPGGGGGGGGGPQPPPPPPPVLDDPLVNAGVTITDARDLYYVPMSLRCKAGERMKLRAWTAKWVTALIHTDTIRVSGTYRVCYIPATATTPGRVTSWRDLYGDANFVLEPWQWHGMDSTYPQALLLSPDRVEFKFRWTAAICVGNSPICGPSRHPTVTIVFRANNTDSIVQSVL